MIRSIFALALFAHGIGHALFVANAWGYWRTDTGQGWLFTYVVPTGPMTENIFGLMWLIPLAGFIVGAWGYITNASGWQPLVLASASVSSILILLWWGSINTSSAIFALIFNLLVIGVILWFAQRMTVSS